MRIFFSDSEPIGVIGEFEMRDTETKDILNLIPEKAEAVQQHSEDKTENAIKKHQNDRLILARTALDEALIKAAKLGKSIRGKS